MSTAYEEHDPRDPRTRFPAAVGALLREAGWEPGRWDIEQAEYWADTLRAHTSPGGHEHAVFPAAVEAWAEFGGLRLAPVAAGRDLAPLTLDLDPLAGLHMARTLADLGRALGTELSPLGREADSEALLAVDAAGAVYAIDHTGDWYVGPDADRALTVLLTGGRPVRLTVG
ncbi:SUKH-3 domain-containing protein [Streptomyces sp. NPDC060194]|uniref:SUKH-3 domain-containing protein n=1 Tax=Streptomyces sp. NPDC060194 TaxID=3347069 RepID=UPI00364CA393